MKISVITWDGNFREFTHTIDFFARQEFAQNDFEFIWVDFYDSNDLVRQKIESYANADIVTIGNSLDTPWHVGKCINAGVKSSSGELLVIPDGDIAVEQDFLSYVWEVHQKYQDLVLYFQRYDEPQQASSDQSRASITYLQQHAKLTSPTNFASCMSLRRKSFERIRGYETHKVFAGPGISGMETYTRLRNAGMAVKWASDKKVYHPWHPSSGSAGHDDRSALWLARHKYHWVIPYAGLKQSWIVHYRELSGDIVADETVCTKYLARMPQVGMNYYRKLAQLINLVPETLKNVSRMFRPAG